ncbi:MAG: DNA primase [Croceibacterium sp.]
MALSPQFLDELRARVTLSGVIMRTTKLQKSGHEWKACCPFHDEKSPSFTVNDQKGFYHCFGCGAHGDVIRWMTDQRGLGFMDAVKELAAQAGMEVPAADPREAQKAERRITLNDVMEAAQGWFVEKLVSPEGARAADYLKSRGFSAAICKEFGFGFAPDSRTAMATALARFDPALLEEAGLRITVEGKEPYDRFRDRLMLPIQDARGRVIAFGGRILDKTKTDAPKYLNSPDTPLFDKGRTLYNLHRAGAASRKTDRVVVVEGYMDVIALAAAGIAEAVAPMGTALTEQQIELLWRMVDRPVLCFDGDAAGKRAAMRAATRALPMLRPGHTLQFVSLPAGMDPDDLIKARGRDAIEQLLAEPAGLLDTIWQAERDAAPLTSPEDKAGLKARLLAHADAIQDPDIKAMYRREWLERFSDFAFPPRPDRPPRPAFTPRAGKGRDFRDGPTTLNAENRKAIQQIMSGKFRDRLTQAVLAGLTRHPHEIARHLEALLDLARLEPALAPAVDALIALSHVVESGGQAPISGTSFQTTPQDNPYAFLSEGIDPVAAREELTEAVALLVERPAVAAAMKQATARFDSDPEGAIAEQQRLRKRMLEIESRVGHMARKRAAAAATQVQNSAAAGSPDGGPDTD